MLCVFAGILSDWYPNLDALKESCRIASSYNWADVDLSPFQGAVWTLQVDVIAFTKHYKNSSNNYRIYLIYLLKDEDFSRLHFSLLL